MSARMVMNGTLVALSAAALIAGILNVETPLRERQRRSDEVRQDHLEQIQSLVSNYQSNRKTLPASLTEAAAAENMNIPHDPETGESYQYRKVGETSYKLCASFRLEARSLEPGYHSEFVVHPAGPHCFELAVKPAGA